VSATFHTFDDLESLSQAAADRISEKISEIQTLEGQINFSLAGGSTPKRLYEILASRSEIDWSKIHLFWGDERCVPLESAESNFSMIQDVLIEEIEIPSGNVHVPHTALPSVNEIAALYEEELLTSFILAGGETQPQIDIAILGMGTDGHTASLFPGRPELDESKRLVVAVNESPTPPHVPRISLSVGILRTAKLILFLVSGESKRPVIEKIQSDPEGAKREYPAALVGLGSNAEWFLDRAASPES